MKASLDELLDVAEKLLIAGESGEALAMLDQAVQAAPESALPFLRRAEVLMRLGGREHLSAALNDLHRAEARQTPSNDRPNPDSLFKKMRIFAELGDLDAARSAYHRLAAGPDGDDPLLREWGVRLAIQAGDLAEALRLVRAARAHDPASFHWARREAALLLESGNHAAARDAFTTLIDAHAPASPAPGVWESSRWAELYLARAEASRHSRDFDAALADIATAEAYMPDDPGVPLARGLIAWARGDADAAFDLLRAALAAAGPDVRVAFWRTLAGYPRLDELEAITRERD